MLLAHYLPKIITALFGGLFIFAGVYTFGNAELFDRIFIGVLIFAAIVCRKNINVLGVLIILVLQRGLDELAWFIFNTDFELTTKILFYALALTSAYFLKYDSISKLLFSCTILALCAEVYWYVSDQNSHKIHWYLASMNIALLVRHALFMRVSYTEDFFPSKAGSINLDWHIYKLNALASIVLAFTLIEYMIWGVFNFSNADVMYTAMPFMTHAISTYAIWITFNESYRLLLPRLLKA